MDVEGYPGARVQLPEKHTRDPLDRYYTPPDVAAQCVATFGARLQGAVVIVAGVGGGDFVPPLRAAGVSVVFGVDLDHTAPGFDLCDVAKVGDFREITGQADAVIGNPPFGVAEEFVRHALTIAPVVGFLLRLAFLSSKGRAPLFRETPFAGVHVLPGRPKYHGPGGTGRTDKYDYGFFVWDRRHVGDPVIRWLK